MPQKLEVIFLFSPEDTTKQPRLENTRYIFTSHGGTVTEESTRILRRRNANQEIEEYTIRGQFPDDIVLHQRTIDHNFIRTYHPVHDSDTAGAAEVRLIDE